MDGMIPALQLPVSRGERRPRPPAGCRLGELGSGRVRGPPQGLLRHGAASALPASPRVTHEAGPEAGRALPAGPPNGPKTSVRLVLPSESALSVLRDFPLRWASVEAGYWWPRRNLGDSSVVGAGGDRTVLFCRSDQRIHTLNEGACHPS